MTETIEIDPDTQVRQHALDAAMWLFDTDHETVINLAELLHTAIIIEHFLTNGATIEFDCVEGLRKTVRGGI